jgi:hypothetical protein
VGLWQEPTAYALPLPSYAVGFRVEGLGFSLPLPSYVYALQAEAVDTHITCEPELFTFGSGGQGFFRGFIAVQEPLGTVRGRAGWERQREREREKLRERERERQEGGGERPHARARERPWWKGPYESCICN